MTPPSASHDDALSIERARSAATLAALHDELDAAGTMLSRTTTELAAARRALEAAEARAAAAEREVAALRATRSVRWATRLRSVLGR